MAQDSNSPPDARGQAPTRLVQHWLLSGGVLIAILLSAEVTARVDDLARLGTPFLATPNFERDMIVQDTFGIRGKPHGHFGRWNLNSDGFRGPELAASPPPGCTRVMILGASESFGHGEQPGQEYPAQLGDSLNTTGCYEVVNAAVIGLPLPGIERLWTNWASRFHPTIVVIYPTPSFYLDSAPPATRRRPLTEAPKRSPAWSSRVLERARSVRVMPQFVGQWWRRRKQAARDASHPPGWLFQTVPSDRLALFEQDLDSLVRQVQALGARPLLVTHATRFRKPLSRPEQALLNDWRQFAPRATAQVILDFEDSAAAATRTLAARRDLALTDAAHLMGGRPDWFTDHQHFSASGAGHLAGLLAQRIRLMLSSPLPATN
jgi:hypothetical protein